MEPVGLGLGIVGLVGLFSTCVQLLEQIDSSRNLGVDSQIMIIRHENNKFLLKRWGKSVGLTTVGLKASHHPRLDDDDTRIGVYNVLAGIQTLFTDVGSLEKKYGLRPVINSATPTTTVASSVALLLKATKRTQDQLSFCRKVVWAIRDKNSFEKLVADIDALVSGLFLLIPLTNDQIEELKISFSDETKTLTTQVTHLKDILDKYLNDNKDKKLLHWLKATSTEHTYHQTISMRHSGTCEWALQLDQLRDWILQDPSIGNPNTTKVLWIYGKPGVGKTYVSATIVEYLKRTSSYPITYYFCAHDDDAKRTTTSILRSWILQLAFSNKVALDTVAGSWVRKVGQEPAESDLWALLETILAKLGPCYLIVDGFDECVDTSPSTGMPGGRAQFLGQLLKSIEPKLGRKLSARVLIVSRDEPDIRESLLDTPSSDITQYKITQQDTEKDLMSFAQGTVEKIPFSISTELRNEIAEGLFSFSGGMFLLIRLLVPYLQPGKTPEELRDAISRTPPGLERLYKRDMDRIRGMVEEERQRAEDILRWVLFSTRPLSVFELAVALQVKGNINTLSQLEKRIPNPLTDEFVEYRILRLCGAFVEVRPDESGEVANATVHFAHFSVKEFLLREVEFKEIPKHHGQLATVCLTFLSYRDYGQNFTVRKNDEAEEHVPYALFFDYAAKSWTSHAREYDNHCEDLLPVLKRFALDPDRTGNYATWLGYVDYDDSGPLHNMCRDGLYSATKYLLENGSNVNTKLRKHGTPLHSAAFSGNKKVVQLLLENGAKIKAAGTLHAFMPLVLTVLPGSIATMCSGLLRETALHVAASQGHIEVAELLLDTGIKVDTKSFLGTALHIAAWKGHDTIVELLLDRGASLVAKTWILGTPLTLPVLFSMVGIVGLLLEKGASVETRLWPFGSLLHAALMVNDGEMVGLLLRKGAKAEAQAWYGPALYITTLHNNAEIEELLLSNGTNIEARTRLLGTPLHLAIILEYCEVVERLLSKGANPEARVWYGGTALHLAIMLGNYNIVERLLVGGANPEARFWFFGTALNLAITRGEDRMVGLLLEHGADTNAKHLCYGDIRVLAEFNGHKGLHDLLKKASMKNPSGDASQHPYSLER